MIPEAKVRSKESERAREKERMKGADSGDWKME